MAYYIILDLKVHMASVGLWVLNANPILNKKIEQKTCLWKLEVSQNLSAEIWRGKASLPETNSEFTPEKVCSSPKMEKVK